MTRFPALPLPPIKEVAQAIIGVGAGYKRRQCTVADINTSFLTFDACYPQHHTTHRLIDIKFETFMICVRKAR